MKKQMIYIMSAALILGSAAPAFAAMEIPEERQLPRLVDDADILDSSEEEELETELDRISEEYQCDVAVVTTVGTEGRTAQEYADDFYDYFGYGYGEGDDGILLLIDLEERQYAISTYGFGIEAFTDDGLDYIEEQFLYYLSDEDLGDNAFYYGIFEFASQCAVFLEQARIGEPFDGDNMPEMPKEPFSLMWIPISIVIGAVISLIVTGIMRLQLKTVRRQSAASEYMKPGSMNLTGSRDLFLYSRVTRVAKPKDNDSSGGSSVHTSSSGRSHGGSSGSF